MLAEQSASASTAPQPTLSCPGISRHLGPRRESVEQVRRQRSEHCGSIKSESSSSGQFSCWIALPKSRRPLRKTSTSLSMATIELSGWSSSGRSRSHRDRHYGLTDPDHLFTGRPYEEDSRLGISRSHPSSPVGKVEFVEVLVEGPVARADEPARRRPPVRYAIPAFADDLDRCLGRRCRGSARAVRVL